MSPILQSLWVGLWATFWVSPVAILAGWYLSRSKSPLKPLIHLILLAPLVLPPVVVGYLLLEVLGPGSWTGHFLNEAMGISLSFSPLAAVIAAAVVGLPLFVVTCRVAFDAVPVELEEMARVAGASSWQIFRWILLPCARPGILGGALLALGRAMGEFGATVIFAGHLSGKDATVALALYEALDQPDSDQTVQTLVVFSLLTSFLLLLGYSRLRKQYDLSGLP